MIRGEIAGATCMRERKQLDGSSWPPCEVVDEVILYYTYAMYH